MTPDYSAVLSRLEKVRRLKGSAWHWLARCPVHGDRRPSLGLRIGESGALLAKCLANHGCTFAGIVQATGTRFEDWFPPKEDTRGGRRIMTPGRKLVCTYDYHDDSGNVAYQVVRYDPKDFAQRRPDGKGGWHWNLEGVERYIYRLPEILAAPSHPVIVVEGEKDAEALKRLGLLSTTNAGGAGKWTPDLCAALRGRRVAILPDNDPPGRSHAIQVAGSLVWGGAAEVRICHLPGLPEKGDVTDWLGDSLPGMTPDKKRASLLHLIKQSPVYQLVIRQAA